MPEGVTVEIKHFLSFPRDLEVKDYMEGNGHWHDIVKVTMEKDIFNLQLVGEAKPGVTEESMFSTTNFQGQGFCHVLATNGEVECTHASPKIITVAKNKEMCPHLKNTLSLHCFNNCSTGEEDRPLGKRMFHKHIGEQNLPINGASITYVMDKDKGYREYKISVSKDDNVLKIYKMSHNLICQYDGAIELGLLKFDFGCCEINHCNKNNLDIVITVEPGEREKQDRDPMEKAIPLKCISAQPPFPPIEVKEGEDLESKQLKPRSRGDGWNYGMIIGNSEYNCPGLCELQSIKEDRKLISERLGHQETYNIDFTCSEHKSQKADYTNVKDIIGQVAAFMKEVEVKVNKARGKGGEVETLLMFFLGHGGQVQGIDCILGEEGKPYPISSILHKIQDKRLAKKVIMILDCCRNRLDPDKFLLSKEEIKNAQDFTAFEKVIRIWSTQETHKATAQSGATFSEALCAVLEKNPDGVKMETLERILNEQWGEKQKKYLKKGRVVYKCKVDLNSDYDSMFPC